MDLYCVKEGVIAELTALEPRRDGQWEADVFVSPVPIHAKAGVCFPPLVLVVETGSGFILRAEVLEPGLTESVILGDAIIESARQHRQIPKIVAVRPGLDASLAPLAAMLGVRIVVRNGMDSLATAWRSLSEKMKKDLPGLDAA
ncbi:MAG: hypothetical protein AAB036_07640 [Elusimicrobiota bacterium]